jgi:hypothetical protein
VDAFLDCFAALAKTEERVVPSRTGSLAETELE